MADLTKPIAGTASISIDGRAQHVAGEFSYQVSTATREALMGLDGYQGFSEKPGMGKISATLRDTGDLSATALGQARNVTVVCELANGKTIVGRNMFTSGPPDAKVEDATMAVEFLGPDVKEA